MSHTIKNSQIRLEAAAVIKAAKHLGYFVSQGTQRMFDGAKHTGVIVKLPGWDYPLVVESDGTMVYDNYKGNWGSTAELEKFTVHALAAMTEGVVDWPQMVKAENGKVMWEVEVR